MNDFFEKVEAELARANEKHPPMAGIIEGLKTLQCEVAEFDREVHRNPVDMVALELELIQVAAMCLKFYKAFAIIPIPQNTPFTFVECEDCEGDGFFIIQGEKCECPDCEGEGKIAKYATTPEPEEVFEIPAGMLVVEITCANDCGVSGTELLVRPFAANAFQITEQYPGDPRKLIEKKHCKPINDPWELFDK